MNGPLMIYTNLVDIEKTFQTKSLLQNKFHLRPQLCKLQMEPPLEFSIIFLHHNKKDSQLS